MSQKIKTSVEIDGSLSASQIANATTDTDKFLVSDSGTVKYRTGAEILSDLGITVNTASKLQHQVKAGVAINKGQAVYVTSADGTNMIVGLASNASEATSSKTMGLLDGTVAINGFANVVTEGLLSGLSITGAVSEGDPVWLGTGGNLIYGLANKPSAPNHLVFIGIVTRVNANNGEIFVKVQNGFELNEIHDVDIVTDVPINGDILGYNGTLWVNKTIAEWLGFTPANDASVVHLSGTETITGQKTFTTGRTIFQNSDAAQITFKNTSDLTKTLNIGHGSNGNIFSSTGLDFRVGGLTSSALLILANENATFKENLTAKSFIKSGGTSSQFLKADGSIDSTTYQTALTNPVTGTGTTNYIPKFTGASAIGNSLIFDNGTNVGIGTASPSALLNVVGASDMSGTFETTGTNNAASLILKSGNGTTSGLYSYLRFINNNTNQQDWRIGTYGNNNFSFVNSKTLSTPMILTTDGELCIGRTSAYGAGWLVNVEGNIYAKYDLRIDGGGSFGGSVGIGTSSTPATKLQVDSANMATDTVGNVFISASDTLAANIGGQLTLGGFYNGSSKYAFGGIAARKENATSGNVAGYLALMSTTSAGALTERMRITSGGNVGIGTTSPSTKLDVNGDINSGATIYSNSFNFRSDNFKTSAATVGKFSTLNQGATDFELIFNRSANGSGAYYSIQSVEQGVAYRNLLFQKDGGNVGIGTTSPEVKLDLLGTGTVQSRVQSTSGGDIRFSVDTVGRIGTYSSSDLLLLTSGTERMRITSGGNVGIGTTSPSEKLTVADGKLFLTPTDTSLGGKIYGYNDTSPHLYGGGLKFQTRYYNGSAYVFEDRLTITSSGNVGIGTTSPINYTNKTNLAIQGAWGGQLDIMVGSTSHAQFGSDNYDSGLSARIQSADGIVFKVNGGTLAATITSDGNVGIGTTSPSQKLVVSGNVVATGFFNSSDIRLKDLVDYDYNVSDIKPITYLWKDGRDNKKHVGYSAQEVQKVMPDAVNEDDKGFLSVNYVEVLVAKIAELENRIKKLEK